MKNKTSVTLTLALVGAVLLASQLRAEEDEKALTGGSIAVAEGVAESAYAGMAKVSMPQAVQAALSQVSGKAIEAKLDGDEGFLVWEVKIQKADQSMMEVTVDAGNALILKKEKEDAEEGNWKVKESAEKKKMKELEDKVAELQK